jgi:hypothetical protein
MLNLHESAIKIYQTKCRDAAAFSARRRFRRRCRRSLSQTCHACQFFMQKMKQSWTTLFIDISQCMVVVALEILTVAVVAILFPKWFQNNPTAQSDMFKSPLAYSVGSAETPIFVDLGFVGFPRFQRSIPLLDWMFMFNPKVSNHISSVGTISTCVPNKKRLKLHRPLPAFHCRV